jgi:hypothetical protein
MILCTSLAHAAKRPGHTWSVIASSDLDARVRRQVEGLAAGDQALVRYFHTPQEAARFRAPRGSLTLEVREETDRAAWLSDLKRQCGGDARHLTPELAAEGYSISATYPRGLALERLRITAASAAGLHYGLSRIPDLLRLPAGQLNSRLLPVAKSLSVSRCGQGMTATLADFPSFRERGIVEGFYGTPWTHQDRLDMMRFMGKHGMNVYYYAPKDDPYHRRLWQEPYPPQEMKRMGELVSTARANFVDFCFAISPGLSMAYSGDADFARLTAKLSNVASFGVSCFALFVDDVPQELDHPEDRARFKTLAEAHASLINRLYDHLKAQSAANRLVVTPTTYNSTWGSHDYIVELGRLANRDVPLVWTGSDTFTPTISVEQAREWGEYLQRPPLTWDNFPVNDGRPWRLFLGPLRGREAGLAEVTQGLFSNPMIQPRASMIPLATIADYLWNPFTYDPERSHTEAIVDQYGKDGPKLLEPFLKAFGDYMWDDDVFMPLFESRRRPIDVPAIEGQVKQLDAALAALKARGSLQKLAAELAPFPSRVRDRLAKVLADPAFERQPDGKLQRRQDADLVSVAHVPSPPMLDGDFSKWQSGTVHTLDKESQILIGAKRWKGPGEFSARVAFAWDESNLYVGVDVTDKDLYQPRTNRGIEEGDAFSLTFETAYQKNLLATTPTGDEYRLYFSPGNFAGVPSSIFPEDDYLPPHPQKHDHNAEIKTAWKRTPNGYSGDIAIPTTYFAGGKFSAGYELGLGFAVQKALAGAQGGESEENRRRVVFVSKSDHLFPVELENPSSYPRMVLVSGAAR